MFDTSFVRNSLLSVFTLVCAATALPSQAAASAADAAPGSTAQAYCLPDSAATASNPQPADYPEIARGAGVTGTALVKVDLTAGGALVATSILQSAGDVYLDRAALAAVRKSTFRPEVRNCTSTGGSYVYAVEFER